jgi:hypothetical protein
MSKNRVNWLTVPQVNALNAACLDLYRVFDRHPYLVGSVLHRADFHDVDVRLMLDDDEYARLFENELWLKLANATISERLARATGLPIDFQFQDTTATNAEFDGYRHALGMFIVR